MTEYEKMLDSANQIGLDIYENYDLSGTRLKGLYCDGSIALSNELITEKEKKCVLAEEIGHHITSTGDIIDQADVSNRKQEMRARVWAYHNAITFSDIINAYKHGCRNRYEISNYLEITESFLDDAIKYFKQKYGLYTMEDNYVIFFEPLGVLDLYK